MWLRWFVSSAWVGLTEQTSAAQLHWDTRATLTGQRRNYSRTSQSVSARWRLPLAPRRRDRIQPTCLEQSACAQTKISFQFRVVKDTTEIHLLGKKISQQCFLPKKKNFRVSTGKLHWLAPAHVRLHPILKYSGPKNYGGKEIHSILQTVMSWRLLRSSVSSSWTYMKLAYTMDKEKSISLLDLRTSVLLRHG